MRHLLSIVFGAAFAITTSWALGRVLFYRLRIALTAAENLLLGTITGASMLSLLVFLLCAAGWARTEVFVVLGAVSVGFALRFRPAVTTIDRMPVPRLLNAMFWIVFTFYAGVYLANSLAPEVSPDGVAYHLGLVARYYRDHGFRPLTTNFYASLTQGMEMLFLFAFAIGRHSAAATVHSSFLFASPFLLREFGQRIRRPIAGVVGGMLFFLSPLAGIDGVSAYNDVALAVTAFALFYLLEIWRESEDSALLIPIGLLAGFCFAIKYTGFVAFLYAVTVILLRRRLKPLLPIAAAAALLALPWLVKNALFVSNPVSPFLNAFFSNPFVHVSFEQNYTAYFRTYDLKSFWPIPWMVTTTGELGGELGPLFLLTPLLLLTLRHRTGRHVGLALLFFLLPYPNNIGARFLLPVLPFAALGIAIGFDTLAMDFLAMDSLAPVLPAVVIAIASLLAWPRIIDRYRAPAGGWQLRSVPWREALRLKDSDAFLFDRIPHVLVARALDEKVAERARVWSTTEVASAYTKRDVLVNYESAEGELIEDILTIATRDDLQPTWNLRMTFPSCPIERFRIVQTVNSPTDVWSIGELRLFQGEREIPRNSNWKVTAKPNPWDVWLALDNNPATRWRTWEPIHAGMYFEVDLLRPIDIDRIEALSSHDQWKVEVHPEICKAEGCKALGAKVEMQNNPNLKDIRRDATRAVLQRNVRYLLIEAAHPLASDIYPDPARWGLRLLADRNRTRLYEIETR